MMMNDYMITRICEKAGIECPPEFYTQNAPESPNDMAKKKYWVEERAGGFLSFLRESAVQSQEKELVKVVHEMEEFQFQASRN